MEGQLGGSSLVMKDKQDEKEELLLDVVILVV